MERVAVPRGKRPRVQVSMDDKEGAIARIRNGETKASISRELGVPESTVRGWVKRADQRMARESSEGMDNPSPPALLPNAIKLPLKRNHYGQKLVPQAMASAATPMPAAPNAAAAAAAVVAAVTVPAAPSVALSMPMQSFHQASDSQLQLNGWLHVFNAGILNFTLIATAAYLRARVRGATDRQSLWQIICDYVDEAGRNVAANGGQYVATAPATATITAPAATQRQLNAHSGFRPPRLHITAEDDLEESNLSASARQ